MAAAFQSTAGAFSYFFSFYRWVGILVPVLFNMIAKKVFGYNLFANQEGIRR